MSRALAFVLVAFFSLFLGTQITEGCLLLPYWKSLAATDFFEYYGLFGARIGKFYTILTIIAALIPLGVTIYSLTRKQAALASSLCSLLFTFLFVGTFYFYFKEANQHFFEAGLSPAQLATELTVWGYWHWFRVTLEMLALISLIMSLLVITNNEH